MGNSRSQSRATDGKHEVSGITDTAATLPSSQPFVELVCGGCGRQKYTRRQGKIYTPARRAAPAEVFRFDLRTYGSGLPWAKKTFVQPKRACINAWDGSPSCPKD